MTQQEKLPPDVLQRRYDRMLDLTNVVYQLGTSGEVSALVDGIAAYLKRAIGALDVLVLMRDDEEKVLAPVTSGGAKKKSDDDDEPDGIPLDSEAAALIAWRAGHPLLVHKSDYEGTHLGAVLSEAGYSVSYTLPLVANDTLLGVLVLKQSPGEELPREDHDLLNQFARSISMVTYNARQHDQAVRQVAESIREASMLQQIDAELNETISLNRVLEMAMDWALRFTNAATASIALYDEETMSFQASRNYGWQVSDAVLDTFREKHRDNITHRVGRTGKMEIVREVAVDKYHGWVMDGIRSQFAMPIIRDEIVVAVVTLESKKLDGFTSHHVSFMEKLTARAAVAIDNARLHSETVREREKLSTILRNTADVVIVIDVEEKILVINQAALNALRLYTGVEYVGRDFADVISFRPLEETFTKAMLAGHEVDEELELPNHRNYFVKITPMQDVGHAIVMQDITAFKETDRLKSDLIATVSHDLKQPLSVMRGYLDLLEMRNTFDEASTNFVTKLGNAISSMRQLIDDLLDLAHIESGMEISETPVPLRELLLECVEETRASAQAKSMSVTTEISSSLPSVPGDRGRLKQVFANLIGNAIKYTPPEGMVRVYVEQRDSILRVGVQDNGLGISPEDQPHIFDRFYRVRRPETDSIEGTGLGLAIVRKLVEAHSGTIRVESQLGEGSTFFVTLPRLENGYNETPAPTTDPPTNPLDENTPKPTPDASQG